MKQAAPLLVGTLPGVEYCLGIRPGDPIRVRNENGLYDRTFASGFPQHDAEKNEAVIKASGIGWVSLSRVEKA